MLRGVSGSGLTLAMIFLIVLRIPALGFCLCQQDITLNNGACCYDASSLANFPSNANCCSSTTEETVKACQDCVVLLSLDPGDFNWSGPPSRFEKPTKSSGTFPIGIQNLIQTKQSRLILPGATRGSPPPEPIPVLRRTGILKL